MGEGDRPRSRYDSMQVLPRLNGSDSDGVPELRGKKNRLRRIIDRAIEPAVQCLLALFSVFMEKKGKKFVGLSLCRSVGEAKERDDLGKVSWAAAVQVREGVVYSSFSPSEAIGVIASSSNFSPRRISRFVSFPITSSAKSLGKS